jgi:hypothetical protein
MALHLPDVSEFQPNINWANLVAANGGAAVIRASYGTVHVDSLWAAGRRASAHAAGIKALGIYQYVRAGEDVSAQAHFFASQVGRLQPGEFLVMDLEEGSGDQLGRAQTWLNIVNQLVPAPAGYNGAWVYSGLSFALSQNLASLFNSTSVHTWVAAYSSVEPSLGHSLWQHSNGSIFTCSHEPWAGIGFCDCSAFNGTLDQLLTKIGGATAPPPPPPPPAANILEDSVNISRDDFTRNQGAVPITLPSAATQVVLYSNRPAILRLDTRGTAGVVSKTIDYNSGWFVSIDNGIAGVVLHRDDPTDTGTNDVSVAFN